MYRGDEESGTKYSEEDRLRDTPSQTSAILPIKISDDQHKIALLDISYKKKWIAYVTYRVDKNTGNLETVSDSNNKKRMFLTRSTFTAKDQTTNIEEFVYSGNPVYYTAKLDCTSFEITDYVKDGGELHCKFLSISHDGKYVVLSFMERNPGKNNHLIPPNNPNCLIFEVKNNIFKLAHEIECRGRAVFLGKKEYCLVIISASKIRVYTDFLKSQSITYLFDLSPLRTINYRLREIVTHHHAFINNTSWFDLSDSRNCDEMERIITFTRHIRQNILTTPFKDVVRIWSIIEDGTRLTSFPAKNQHIMAFSKNYKYAAAYVEYSRSINIYNVKSGLLVYRLQSRDISGPEAFTVSHIRFCYDGRYIAMSGWEGNMVSFEVWYIEAERSIYSRTLETFIEKPSTIDGVDEEDSKPSKIINPFVSRGLKDGRKCLKGYYTSYPNGEMTTMCVELNIDEEDEDFIDWNKEKIPFIKATSEIGNSLRNSENLKSGIITIGGNKYLLRFGIHTVQLWNVSPNSGTGGLIHEDDKLLYIRAYKGPDYGLDYSFRETWRIHTYNSIRFIKGEPLGRMLVNITEMTNKDNKSRRRVSDIIYHTEEIFLPLEELLPSAPTEELSSKIINGGALRFDYHKFESACQALHFLCNPEDHAVNVKNREIYETNLGIIRRKTEDLIRSSLNLDIKYNYFSTIAGSRTLAMLASFGTGRGLIKLIIAKSIPISIFSYARSRSEINKDNLQETDEEKIENKEFEYYIKKKCFKNISDENSGRTYFDKVLAKTNTPIIIKRNDISYRSAPPKIAVKTPDDKIIVTYENVLTVLIDKLCFTLYKLLFNRILSDSKKLGPGCLLSLTDALLFLQERGTSDLLQSSIQKLSYLEIEKEKLGILAPEIIELTKVKGLQKKKKSGSIRFLETHAAMEQIRRYSNIFSIHLYHIRKRLNRRAEQTIWLKKIIIHSLYFYRFKIKYSYRILFLEPKKEIEKLTKICIVPLPYFISYCNFPEDRPKNINYDENNDEIISYKPYSAFLRVALNQDEDNMFRQGDTVLEVLLEYKWQNFVRNRFIAICLIHAAYYISYFTGVLFAPELYDIVPGEGFVLENSGQILSIVLMFICLAVLVVQEFRQFLNTHDKADYIFSGYNWVDICAYTFPVITFVQLLCGWDSFSEVSSVATLILWTHAILRLRVISHFGITLETIIQLSKSIASVLFVMLLVIFAFTQSYIVLLRLNSDEYFQDNFDGSFSGTAELETGEIATEGTVGFAASSADNGFSDWFKAFYQVWLFIYGVWDPIIEGDVGDSKMVMALSIIFSLITVMIFFNMVIAFMSSTVEDVKARGKKVWVSHFAAVISEIELLWCRKGTKNNGVNNPTYIYYIASYDAVSAHEKKLQEESKQLLAELNISADYNRE